MVTRPLPPASTEKALWPLNAIIRVANKLGIGNDASARFIDRNYDNYYTMTQMTFEEMARDQERLLRFSNNHQICQLSRKIKSPYLDCWEGTFNTSTKLHYFTTNREVSLKRIIEFHRTDEYAA